MTKSIVKVLYDIEDAPGPYFDDMAKNTFEPFLKGYNAEYVGTERNIVFVEIKNINEPLTMNISLVFKMSVRDLPMFLLYLDTFRGKFHPNGVRLCDYKGIYTNDKEALEKQLSFESGATKEKVEKVLKESTINLGYEWYDYISSFAVLSKDMMTNNAQTLDKSVIRIFTSK